VTAACSDDVQAGGASPRRVFAAASLPRCRPVTDSTPTAPEASLAYQNLLRGSALHAFGTGSAVAVGRASRRGAGRRSASASGSPLSAATSRFAHDARFAALALHRPRRTALLFAKADASPPKRFRWRTIVRYRPIRSTTFLSARPKEGDVEYVRGLRTTALYRLRAATLFDFASDAHSG